MWHSSRKTQILGKAQLGPQNHVFEQVVNPLQREGQGPLCGRPPPPGTSQWQTQTKGLKTSDPCPEAEMDLPTRGHTQERTPASRNRSPQKALPSLTS